MKRQIPLRASAALFASLIGLFFCSAALAAEFSSKDITVLHSGDTRPCSFFRLDGAAEAVPAVAGNPWFGVPQTHTHYKEIVAYLLAAKVSGRKVSVTTTDGAGGCGHAEVIVVTLH